MPPSKLLGAPPITSTTTLIPDVSEWNEGCTLYSEAIFRVYEGGTDRQDSKASCHAEELRRKGKWAAVYSFLRTGRSCVYQAARTIAIVRSLPVEVQVIVGDAETGIREGKVACFLHEIERQGYPAIEYTCPGCGDEQVGKIWIAAYPFRPAGRWLAHQFSSTFNCRGAYGDCSIDEGLLSITRKPKPTPKPHSRQHLKDRIRVLHRELAVMGCRRRVRQRQPLGPRCVRWFDEGNRDHALLKGLR